MALFKEAQIRELEEIFGIKRVMVKKEAARIKDGWITKGDHIWWRADTGPLLVDSSLKIHWNNLQQYPQAYSIDVPATKIIYID